MPKYLNEILVKLNGANAPTTFFDALTEVVVDTSLGMPSMCSIRLYDQTLSWVDDASLDLGKSLEVSVKAGGASAATVIFKGEITALEPQFSAEGKTMMQIRGYDKSHRLHRGRKTRSFLKVKDSELASTIGGEAGLTVEVDATSVTHDYVIQYNQTNMEFLASRAERIGYQVIVGEGKLQFKKASYSSATTILTFMENLMSFQPRWAATHQADTMTVRGWDVAKKAAIVSTKSPNASFNQGGMAKTGGAYATSAFSAATETLVDQFAFDSSDGTEIATGLSDDISRDFVEADGICVETPTVQAGTKVTVKKVGTRFSGDYYVTSATHIYNSNGYETHFTISGRHPQTLSRLVDGQGSAADGGTIQGYVTALVSNLNDPDGLGRAKVKYAWLGDVESDWMRIASPMAGSSRGFMFLPEINDEVVVAFEHGDVHRPCIVGALWSKIDKPPVANSVAVENGKVNQRMIKTRAGHIILMDDKQGEEKISVKSKSGAEIILDDKTGSESVTIKDKTGSNSMVIKSSDNSMTIKVNGDFNVTATGKITMKSTMDMSLESSTNAKVKGLQLALEGTAKGELKAAQVSINGSAMTEVKAGAMLQLQGALVKIN